MYAASLVFLLGAAASLYLGFRHGRLTFVFASIAASMLSMLFLGVSILRRRSVEALAPRQPFPSAPPEEETPVAHDVPEDTPGTA
ncbi:MAG TPA: hypothetical protein VM638_02615 [Actinomycetota bacterium]|nr:hypothetical protein [Actinomycetota bacterium]